MTTELDDLTMQARCGFGEPPNLALQKYSLRRWVEDETVNVNSLMSSLDVKLTVSSLEVRKNWVNLLYKMEVLQGLLRRMVSEKTKQGLQELINRLTNIKFRYQEIYQDLPRMSEPKKDTLVAIVLMLKNLCNALMAELTEFNDQNLEDDLDVILERIRGFWRMQPTLLGGGLVPPPRQDNMSIIQYYNKYFRKGKINNG